MTRWRSCSLPLLEPCCDKGCSPFQRLHLQDLQHAAIRRMWARAQSSRPMFPDEYGVMPVSLMFEAGQAPTLALMPACCFR